MPVIEALACSLGRRDEVPNQQLALRILETNDEEAIRELFEALAHPGAGIAGDAIKVIYEIAGASPGLIAPFSGQLELLLSHKNNRVRWGAMTALDAITNHAPDRIHAALPTIIAAADKGSVITNDHCMGILVKLCAFREYARDAFTLFMDRLKQSPVNQLPMYAELAYPIITGTTKKEFIDVLTARLKEVEKPSKKLRVEKILKNLVKQS